MGFASNSKDDQCEKLYIHTTYKPQDHALGVIDVTADPMLAQNLGAVMASAAELTGTGDGDLYAFVTGNPARVLWYDKGDADVLDEWTLQNFVNNGSFAFAHWDGDFYLFTSAGLADSIVTKYDFTGDESLTKVADAPINVVGAGVSTCAPVPQ
jgi:hypothetical protein